MSSVLNAASYRFCPIVDPRKTREDLLTAIEQWPALRGTVLVTPEGLNAFLAGPERQVRSCIDWLRCLPGFENLEVKWSWSDHVPFKRMRVKLKNEIIRMNNPVIRPFEGRAPAAAAATVANWLAQGHDDQGRPVVMLDTRNAFEVDLGRFENAIDWRIEKFTQFPQALQDHLDELEGKTVVSYCTGGIRCEKAALFMQSLGLEHVYQLEGGILKYFEEVGGDHWRGDCFVFDERVGLDPTLSALSEREAQVSAPPEPAQSR
jgi:UPF0176 protein